MAIALGALFVLAAAIASDPEYFSDPAADLYMLATGVGFAAACVAIFGLTKRSPVVALVGAAGIAATAVLLVGVLETSDPPANELGFYRTVFALVLLLAVFVVLLARQLRAATPRGGRAR